MASNGGRSAGWVLAAVLGCLGVLLVLAGVLVGVALWVQRAPAPPVAPPSPGLGAAGETAEASPSADPNPRVSVKRTSYTVRGDSPNELRKQMQEHGPTGAAGRHDAYTTWYVRWSYPFERGTDGCGLGHVTVNVDVTITMPEWQTPPDAKPSLTAAWKRYLDALQTHENGHRDHGIGAGREVLRRLRAIEKQDRCETAEQRANAIGRQVVEEYRQRDLSYDRTTRHGATQGARFP